MSEERIAALEKRTEELERAQRVTNALLEKYLESLATNLDSVDGRIHHLSLRLGVVMRLLGYRTSERVESPRRTWIGDLASVVQIFKDGSSMCVSTRLSDEEAEAMKDE